MKIIEDEQKQFFDIAKNQYPEELINNPLPHTVLEVEEIIKRLKGIKEEIADFGAGTGRISIPLLKKGFAVFSIDISIKSLRNIKRLSKKFKKIKTYTSLPRNKKFKAIVGADILHHINCEKYLPLIFNSLKKGGKVVFSEPGAFNPSWYLYLPIASSWQAEKGVLKCTYFNLKKEFEKSGFRNIKISGLGFFPRPIFNFSSKLSRLNDKVGDLPFIKLFAYRYIIEAKA